MSLLAGPPQDCCFSPGVKHEGTPVGTKETIADVETYVSAPPEAQASAATTRTKKVILFFSDIHSPFYLNNQLLMDYFASHGFHVLGLDYFFGSLVENEKDKPGFNREAWRKKAKEQADAAVPKWVDAVRAKYGEDAKYAAVGYCFGAPYAVQLASTDKVVAGAFAHPSSLTEKDFHGIKKPFFLSCAETDSPFPADKRRLAEDILVKNKTKYTFQIFSGVSHGFAVRGDPKDDDQRWAKEESARGIIGWFSRFAV